MSLKTVSRLVAALDVLAAVATFWAAVGFWDGGQQSENVGEGLIAMVRAAVSLGMVAIGVLVALVWSKGDRSRLALVAATLLGLLPPAAVAPFAFDADQRSTRG